MMILPTRTPILFQIPNTDEISASEVLHEAVILMKLLASIDGFVVDNTSDQAVAGSQSQEQAEQLAKQLIDGVVYQEHSEQRLLRWSFIFDTGAPKPSWSGKPHIGYKLELEMTKVTATAAGDAGDWGGCFQNNARAHGDDTKVKHSLLNIRLGRLYQDEWAGAGTKEQRKGAELVRTISQIPRISFV